MAKKKKKKKSFRSILNYENVKFNLDLNPDTSREIIAFIIGLLALFITLSLVGLLGNIGIIIKTILTLSFGLTAYLTPFILLYYCLNTLIPERIIIETRQSISIFLSFLALNGLLSILYHTPDYSLGGYIGNGFMIIGQKSIGSEGTIIFIFAIFLISYLLFTNTSFLNIFQQIKNLIKPRQYSQFIPNNTSEHININTFQKDKNISENISDKKILPQNEIKNKLSISKTPVSDTKLVTAQNTENFDINWQLPPLSLLEESKSEILSGNIDQNVKIIESTLTEFGIEVEMKDVNIGPTVTQYTFKPATGVKLSKITALQNDLALALAAHPVRVEAPIPGKALVGIEIPNKKPAPVRLKEMLESPLSLDSSLTIPIPLGRDISGTPTFENLTKMPHMLIAGSTGSGKSVFINSVLITILMKFTPEHIRCILIDPKRVELSNYNKLPHLLTPVVTESKNALSALKWALTEMNDRYKLLSEHKTRNIQGYNQKFPKKKLPYIIIVIDELADLMMTAGNDIETAICRLAQMARATGIHLIIATQRPSVDVITGLIKANIATRIAFAVASQIDSRTILDMGGAEKLLGKGDMLYISRESGKPRRIQGVLISDQEIESITQFWKNEGPQPEYFSEILSPSTNENNPDNGPSFNDVDDDLFNEVINLVISTQQASASFLQRKLKIGYARAARLIDILEQKKVISIQEGNKPRQVLIKSINDLKTNT